MAEENIFLSLWLSELAGDEVQNKIKIKKMIFCGNFYVFEKIGLAPRFFGAIFKGGGDKL